MEKVITGRQSLDDEEDQTLDSELQDVLDSIVEIDIIDHRPNRPLTIPERYNRMNNLTLNIVKMAVPDHAVWSDSYDKLSRLFLDLQLRVLPDNVETSNPIPNDPVPIVEEHKLVHLVKRVLLVIILKGVELEDK